MATESGTSWVDDASTAIGRMGPSWVAGAIAAGPATMASLVTAGATFGYQLLWVVLLSAGLGALSQFLAARLGLLTEAGIINVVEERLGEWWAWLLVVDVVFASGLAQLVIMKGLADVSATITGIDARIWGIVWALVLAVGLATGGYRFVEVGAKVVISFVVVVFLASLTIVPIDVGAAARGLTPVIPAGLDGALVAAGILGGAVHVTLVTMHSYNMRARGWTRADGGVATMDIAASMLGAFGAYSLGIFLVAASVLHTANLDPATLTAVGAAEALGPIVGSNAKWLFLLGLWGAAVSTLGSNTVTTPYLIADKLGFGRTMEDSRYRAMLVIVALASAAGAFIGGSFFPLLVLVLAFGLVGTPFALVVVLVLLNDDRAVPETNGRWLNAAGIALVVVTVVTAGSFVRQQVASGDLLGLSVGVFAAVFGVATLVLVGKHLTR